MRYIGIGTIICHVNRIKKIPQYILLLENGIINKKRRTLYLIKYLYLYRVPNIITEFVGKYFNVYNKILNW